MSSNLKSKRDRAVRLYLITRSTAIFLTLAVVPVANGGTFERMNETVRQILGPGASVGVTLSERNFASRGYPGSYAATLTVRDSTEKFMGRIELLSVPYAAKYEALDEGRLVKRTLDLLPDHRNYPEMVRVLARSPPSLRAQKTRAILATCATQLVAPEPEARPIGLRFNPRVMIGDQRAATAIFFLKPDGLLEVTDLRANANLEDQGVAVRRRGFSSRLVAAALAQFPTTRAIEIPSLVDDNGVLSRVRTPRKFAGSLFLVPTYRTLNRLGFGRVRTIFVRHGELGSGRPPAYGLTLERW